MFDDKWLNAAFERGVGLQASAVTAWRDILSDISETVGDTRYNLWFKNTLAIACDNGRLEIGVPSAFMADWLEKHYRTLIVEVATTRLGRPVALNLVVDPELFQTKRREEALARNEIIEEAVPEKPVEFDTARYTLDNFVVGPCNAVAYAAALEVVKKPGGTYNPLFLHGGVGLGKTHLLWGIAGALGVHRRKSGIEYVSAEAFTNRFIFALRNGSLDAFRLRYRKLRLLVIDDVHFLSSKAATQEEFLNTYNTLSRDGCQIVMASDSHPKLIRKMKETLVTRFLSGMVVRLEKPGFNTRLDIVRHKAAERKLVLDGPTADFVARNVKGSVREIEGAVNTLAAYTKLSARPANIAVAREALKALIEMQCRPVRLPEIDDIVTGFAGLSEGDLRSKRRTRPVSKARHLAMYLARTMGSFSYSEIGAYFGGRNHSSVVSAVSRIESLVKEDPEFAGEVAALKEKFGA